MTSGEGEEKEKGETGEQKPENTEQGGEQDAAGPPQSPKGCNIFIHLISSLFLTFPVLVMSKERCEFVQDFYSREQWTYGPTLMPSFSNLHTL